MATNNTNDGASQVAEKIEKFSDKYRPVAKKLHALIMKTNPDLHPRLWYGMPGYAKTKDSAVLCFFREDKYISFGLTENAKFNLAEGAIVGSAWFLTSLDEDSEQKIKQIIKEATL